MRFDFSRWVPARHALVESRWLKPFRTHLHDKRLWRLERYAVARGVAIGLFFGLLIPFGQIPVAALAAVWLRGNLTVSMICTLITNPFTFAPVYWFAYRIGLWIYGNDRRMEEAERMADSLSHTADQVVASSGWLSGVMFWLQDAGLPLLSGLALLAVLGAISGYFLVHLGWQLRRCLPERRRRAKAARENRPL